jgi:hypothetical protein
VWWTAAAAAAAAPGQQGHLNLLVYLVEVLMKLQGQPIIQAALLLVGNK